MITKIKETKQGLVLPESPVQLKTTYESTCKSLIQLNEVITGLGVTFCFVVFTAPTQ